MTEERKLELDNNCLQLRSDLIDLLHSIQTGHPGVPSPRMFPRTVQPWVQMNFLIQPII